MLCRALGCELHPVLQLASLSAQTLGRTLGLVHLLVTLLYYTQSWRQQPVLAMALANQTGQERCGRFGAPSSVPARVRPVPPHAALVAPSMHLLRVLLYQLHQLCHKL